MLNTLRKLESNGTDYTVNIQTSKFVFNTAKVCSFDTVGVHIRSYQLQYVLIPWTSIVTLTIND